MSSKLIDLRDAAEAIAREAGQSTLKYFKKSFDLEFKSDETPVTNADREAEELVRERVKKKFPDHGMIGEEFGSEGEEREVVWVVDPIDGTQSFIHGVPFYTTLIGILVKGIPQVGVIYAPALEEMVIAASGSGAFLNGEPCKTRTCKDLRSATFLTTDLAHIRQYKFERSFEDLFHQTRIHRTWGDAYGHLMVATGRADIMFDPVLSIWDAAALLPVVTESGGSFTDVHGVETIRTGNALSCTKQLKSDVLSIFGS